MDNYNSKSSFVISNVKDDRIQVEILNPNFSEDRRRASHVKEEEVRNHSFGNKILLSLPIGAFLIPSTFVIAAYLYASYRRTLMLPKTRRVPYISDVGDSAPQSGLFTIGLVLSSYFTFAVVTVRFFQIRSFVTNVNLCMNSFGLALGILIVIGKIIVASFRISEHFLAHFIGAGIYVLSSAAYVLLQFFIFLKDTTAGGKYRTLLLGFRALLSVGLICGTLLFGVFILPPLMQYNRAGYSMAQSGEWCFAVCKLLFMLTFVAEFWNLRSKFCVTLTSD